MTTKYEKIPDTDTFYRVIQRGEYVGTVKKVWMTRTTAGWLAYDPVDTHKGPRIIFSSRKEAAETLVMRSLGKKFTYPLG